MYREGDIVFSYFKTLGNAAPTLNEVTFGAGESTPYWFYPFQTTALTLWTTDQPDLTVEDLADSIESMLARRESGLSSPATLMQMRDYPTDPSTQRSAVAFLKDLRERGEAELQTLNAQIETEAKTKAKADAKAKVDREAFEAFQAKQQSSNPS